MADKISLVSAELSNTNTTRLKASRELARELMNELADVALSW
jgi:hypothetical protein